MMGKCSPHQQPSRPSRISSPSRRQASSFKYPRHAGQTSQLRSRSFTVTKLPETPKTGEVRGPTFQYKDDAPKLESGAVLGAAYCAPMPRFNAPQLGAWMRCLHSRGHPRCGRPHAFSKALRSSRSIRPAASCGSSGMSLRVFRVTSAMSRSLSGRCTVAGLPMIRDRAGS